jgi:hypothetical protein
MQWDTDKILSELAGPMLLRMPSLLRVLADSPERRALRNEADVRRILTTESPCGADHPSQPRRRSSRQIAKAFSMSQPTIRKGIEASQTPGPTCRALWICRSMVLERDVSHHTVRRMLIFHDLKRNCQRSFRVRLGNRFIEKLTDGVGLYRNPPDKDMVLGVVERSAVQAPEQTQPVLPLGKGS